MSEGESGLRSFAIKIKHALFPQKTSEATPQSNQEAKMNPDEIEKYIHTGLDLIKSNQYQEAISYFQDWKSAESMGIQTTNSMFYPLKSLPDPVDGY